MYVPHNPLHVDNGGYCLLEEKNKITHSCIWLFSYSKCMYGYSGERGFIRITIAEHNESCTRWNGWSSRNSILALNSETVLEMGRS